MKIPFSKPDFSDLERQRLMACFNSLELSGDGSFTKAAEEKLRQITGSKHALLTHSCTGALEMAMILADVGPGDEVIVPDFTFVSSADAIVVRGATPVFVDVSPDTLNISPESILQAITPKTKALMVVHYAGVAAPMCKILDIARGKKSLHVIEDAAQCIGSTYKGKALGTIGDTGALSFHNTKNISSGEGGALLIQDEKLEDRAHIIREKGTNRRQFLNGVVDKYTWVDLGSSYVVSELNASILSAQLDRFDEITFKRMKLFDTITQFVFPRLAKHGYVVPTIPVDTVHNGHIIWAVAPDKKERDRALVKLRSADVNAVFHFQSLSASPAGRKFGRQGSQSLAVSMQATECLLRLPIYSGMTDQELEYLLDQLGKCWE